MHLSLPSTPFSAPSPAAELPCNDVYVVAYDFKSIDSHTAIKEFRTLLEDLEAAGLHAEVRAGYEQTLLVFVKAPRELLGNTVYKLRVKDWLYGVTPSHPGGTKDTIVDGAYEAEDVLSMYHLVHWPKDLGGAGISPGIGKWKNVRAIFPLHNQRVNQSLLRHLSKRVFLTTQDLDSIRDLFGSKVAFYFAFIQTYLAFLTFPAVTGLVAWLWLPKYSLVYAITTCIWCSVFLEYWKIQEVDLSIRWGVKGVNKVKVNRPQFVYERIFVDGSGRTIHYFPKWKQLTRQLLQIPFVAVAMLALGVILAIVFAIEVLISETYAGPYKFYLEYLPTVLLAVALPSISSSLEDVADWLTEFENHRTADSHEMSLAQKVFVLNIITNYLPILLTAFVYVPFGDDIVPWLRASIQKHLGSPAVQKLAYKPFTADHDKLRNEVIALTVTGQIWGFFEENILPYIRHKLQGWYRDFRRARTHDGSMLLTVVRDEPDEADLLARARDEATLDQYNVHEDVAEIVLQFGHLALFSPVWPVLAAGFLLNNWVEVRSDFAKICIEHRRPAPARADGIGPWVGALEFLAWAGSISTAAIVHLFGAEGAAAGSAWWSLAATVFVSEHVLLAVRALVRFALRSAGSEQIRRERDVRYANRRRHLDEMEAHKQAGLALSVAERERRRTVLAAGGEAFWTRQAREGAGVEVGVGLIERVKRAEESRGVGGGKGVKDE